jgi:hypothetical protein
MLGVVYHVASGQQEGDAWSVKPLGVMLLRQHDAAAGARGKRVRGRVSVCWLREASKSFEKPREGDSLV